MAVVRTSPFFLFRFSRFVPGFISFIQEKHVSVQKKGLLFFSADIEENSVVQAVGSWSVDACCDDRDNECANSQDDDDARSVQESVQPGRSRLQSLPGTAQQASMDQLPAACARTVKDG